MINLTRKWRAKNFDQIIGQELVVRIIKNSLYAGQIFPVYLLAGQRGCGKTSIARVFAGALNCKGLGEFRKNPRSGVIPCLSCESCLAMKGGNHPDFIEMDAASHTGVDNVRDIIESASFVPLFGGKKVYLIDEAHMLSKAAFNALLKIMEEPPPAVIFILATTDPQKIIETVRSRCFQLFFQPVVREEISGHLKNICSTEGIAAEEEAIDLTSSESGGAVRDAINLLEQVRFSSDGVTKKGVLSVLGRIDDDQLVELFKVVRSGNIPSLFVQISEMKIEDYAATSVFYGLMDLVRFMLWTKNGVSPGFAAGRFVSAAGLVKSCSVEMLADMLSEMCDVELALTRTREQHALWERVLVGMCRVCQVDPLEIEKVTESPSPQPELVVEKPVEACPASCSSCPIKCEGAVEDKAVEVKEAPALSEAKPEVVGPVLANELAVDTPKTPESTSDDKWGKFVLAVSALGDPLLESVFKHGRPVGFDGSGGALTVTFAGKFSFFQDWIKDSEATWMPMLRKSYEGVTSLVSQFDVSEPEGKEASVVTSAEVKIAKESPVTARVQTKPKVGPVDISDDEKWKVANMLAKQFPGAITEVPEDSNG